MNERPLVSPYAAAGAVRLAGFEPAQDVKWNSSSTPAALQSALQIDAARLVEAVNRLSPEERAAVLRALAAEGAQ